MDVLQYWSPTIDWTRFEGGGVSEPMWQCFTQLVQLCHAYRYWDDAARNQRRERPVRPIYPETSYKRRQRQNEWKREIEQSEGHKYRAAYLVAEKMAEMSNLLTPDNEGPDAILYMALRLAVEPFPNHERARCQVAAFESFNATRELAGQPRAIADAWLSQSRDGPL